MAIAQSCLLKILIKKTMFYMKIQVKVTCQELFSSDIQSAHPCRFFGRNPKPTFRRFSGAAAWIVHPADGLPAPR
jgi:hypothetical protein